MLYTIAIFAAVLGYALANPAPAQPGEQVVHISLKNDQQVSAMQELVDRYHMDVWTGESALRVGLNDVRVNTTHLHAMDKAGILYTPFIEDIYQLIKDHSRKATDKVSNEYSLDWFENYHTYDEMVQFYEEICTKFANNGVECFRKIGESYEGRDLFGFVIDYTTTSDAKSVYFQGGQHAREWINPATLWYIVYQMLETRTTNLAIRDILSKYRLYVLPMANPDGYTFSWTNNRLWRKNRRQNQGSLFYGVDLNRNWDDHWGTVGISRNPASDTYCGTGPFSEPESTAISNWLNDIIREDGLFVGAIDFHSYSQLMLRPYGWTSASCPDETSLRFIGQAVSDSIQEVHGTAYRNIKSAELYPTSGSAGDWFYGASGIFASYTIELRDTGRYGFVLPPEQIIPSGEETLAGIISYFQMLDARQKKQ